MSDPDDAGAPSRPPGALRRHPLAAGLAVAAAAVLAAAIGVLPRLDAVEIARVAVEDGSDPGRATLVAAVRLRLASAGSAELLVRAPAPDGGAADAAASRAVQAGRHDLEVRLGVPRREAWVVIAELRPAARGGSPLEALLARRRRDSRIVTAGR